MYPNPYALKANTWAIVFGALASQMCVPQAHAQGSGLQEVGTTPPLYRPRELTGDREIDRFRNAFVRPCDSYYSVRVVGTRLNLKPKGWFSQMFRKAKYVCITSSASVSEAPSIPQATGIHQIIPVRQGRSNLLGFSPTLVDYIPAIGKTLNLSFEYRVTASSPLADFLSRMATFVNDSQQPLAKALSVSSPEMAGAASIGSVAAQLVSALFPATETTTLGFSGSFPLTNSLRSGYYFILASDAGSAGLPKAAERTALDIKRSNPSSLEAFLVDDKGEQYTKTSYVIFEVDYYPTLGHKVEPKWLRIYSDAVQKSAEFKAETTNPTTEQKTAAWKECKGLLDQARAFSDEDARYLASEKAKHYFSSYNKCWKNIKNCDPPIWDEDLAKELTQFDLDLRAGEKIDSAMQSAASCRTGG
jgi:hypothetical protein